MNWTLAVLIAVLSALAIVHFTPPKAATPSHLLLHQSLERDGAAVHVPAQRPGVGMTFSICLAIFFAVSMFFAFLAGFYAWVRLPRNNA